MKYRGKLLVGLVMIILLSVTGVLYLNWIGQKDLSRTAGGIEVNWFPEPLKANDDPFFAPGLSHPDEGDFLYKMGDISKGKYAGFEYFVSYGLDFSFIDKEIGAFFNSAPVAFIRKDDRLIHVYSDEIEGSRIVNADLPPKEIEINGSSDKLVRVGAVPFFWLEVKNNLIPVEEVGDGAHLFIGKFKGITCFACGENYYYFLMAGRDGRMWAYTINFGQNLDNDLCFEAEGKIRWRSGQESEEKYQISLPSIGCSVFSYPNIEEADLVEAGASDIGTIYELTGEAREKRGREVYNIYLEERFNYMGDNINEESTRRVNENAIKYADFINDHPFVYLRDPVGRFIELVNMRYLAYFMAKPVIYLYPQREEDVSVQVDPEGGLTLTEPVYNNGWTAKAYPDGKIFNYDDGKYYKYLFWEGTARNLFSSPEGFVVRGEEMDQFLRQKLALLGLNYGETADFIDFWKPKFYVGELYFINFVPKDYLDQMAPLSIEPKPDTMIRVFMNYRKIGEIPPNFREQKLITPVRKGFTVVEWGGAGYF